jgi:hypothetical protein
MVPDVAPNDGVQPEPQFAPPHVRVSTAKAALYLPASQLVQTVDAGAPEYLPASQLVQTGSATAPRLQVPVKPLLTPELSDVKVTLRKPVVDV